MDLLSKTCLRQTQKNAGWGPLIPKYCKKKKYIKKHWLTRTRTESAYRCTRVQPTTVLLIVRVLHSSNHPQSTAITGGTRSRQSTTLLHLHPHGLYMWLEAQYRLYTVALYYCLNQAMSCQTFPHLNVLPWLFLGQTSMVDSIPFNLTTARGITLDSRRWSRSLVQFP